MIWKNSTHYGLVLLCFDLTLSCRVIFERAVLATRDRTPVHGGCAAIPVQSEQTFHGRRTHAPNNDNKSQGELNLLLFPVREL